MFRADGPGQPRMDAAAQDTASRILTTSTGAGVVARDMGAAALRADPVGELPGSWSATAPGSSPNPPARSWPAPASRPSPTSPSSGFQRRAVLGSLISEYAASRIEAQVKTCGHLWHPTGVRQGEGRSSHSPRSCLSLTA